MPNHTWHLAPAGQALCDYGFPVSREECETAVNTLALEAGKIPGRIMQVGCCGARNDGAWGQVPLGCSAQTGGDNAAYFKTIGINCDSYTNDYQLVCSEPKTPCSGMLVEIKVWTYYDGRATTWTLSNQCGLDRGMSGGPYYRVSECLPAGEYKFTINDEECNGRNGDVVEYQILVNGLSTYKSTVCGSSETKTFGSTCTSESPSSSASPSTSSSPSESPTQSSSPSTSVSPSDVPAGSKSSKNPFESPSSIPSEDPSESPSGIPSEDPSERHPE